jgi:hypothetical protein
MRRTTSRARVVAPAVLLALLLAACTSGPDAPPTDVDPDEEPVPAEPAPEPDGEEVDADPLAARVQVFFGRSTADWIWVEPVERWVEIDAEADTDRAAITSLFAHGPEDPDLFTAVPDGVTVLGVERDGQVLLVDVDDAMHGTSGGSAQELAFAEQLAHTAAALDGIDTVRLLVAGEPIDELWGHLDWSVPIEPDPFALSPITIEVPAYGATVPVGELVASGRATVFEANFMIRLFGPDGTMLVETNVMASMGAPERGSWDHTFTIPDPGRYVIEIEEDDPSGGEGRTPLVVRREVEVVAP